MVRTPVLPDALVDPALPSPRRHGSSYTRNGRHAITQGRRCPVCNGAETDARCFSFLSSGRDYAYCTGEDFKGHLTVSRDGTTYRHRLGGAGCGCGRMVNISTLRRRSPPEVAGGRLM